MSGCYISTSETIDTTEISYSGKNQLSNLEGMKTESDTCSGTRDKGDANGMVDISAVSKCSENMRLIGEYENNGLDGIDGLSILETEREEHSDKSASISSDAESVVSNNACNQYLKRCEVQSEYNPVKGDEEERQRCADLKSDDSDDALSSSLTPSADLSHYKWARQNLQEELEREVKIKNVLYPNSFVHILPQSIAAGFWIQLGSNRDACEEKLSKYKDNDLKECDVSRLRTFVRSKNDFDLNPDTWWTLWHKMLAPGTRTPLKGIKEFENYRREMKAIAVLRRPDMFTYCWNSFRKTVTSSSCNLALGFKGLEPKWDADANQKRMRVFIKHLGGFYQTIEVFEAFVKAVAKDRISDRLDEGFNEAFFSAVSCLIFCIRQPEAKCEIEVWVESKYPSRIRRQEAFIRHFVEQVLPRRNEQRYKVSIVFGGNERKMDDAMKEVTDCKNNLQDKDICRISAWENSKENEQQVSRSKPLASDMKDKLEKIENTLSLPTSTLNVCHVEVDVSSKNRCNIRPWCENEAGFLGENLSIGKQLGSSCSTCSTCSSDGLSDRASTYENAILQNRHIKVEGRLCIRCSRKRTGSCTCNPRQVDQRASADCANSSNFSLTVENQQELEGNSNISNKVKDSDDGVQVPSVYSNSCTESADIDTLNATAKCSNEPVNRHKECSVAAESENEHNVSKGTRVVCGSRLKYADRKGNDCSKSSDDISVAFGDRDKARKSKGNGLRTQFQSKDMNKTKASGIPVRSWDKSGVNAMQREEHNASKNIAGQGEKCNAQGRSGLKQNNRPSIPDGRRRSAGKEQGVVKRRQPYLSTLQLLCRSGSDIPDYFSMQQAAYRGQFIVPTTCEADKPELFATSIADLFTSNADQNTVHNINARDHETNENNNIAPCSSETQVDFQSANGPTMHNGHSLLSRTFVNDSFSGGRENSEPLTNEVGVKRTFMFNPNAPRFVMPSNKITQCTGPKSGADGLLSSHSLKIEKGNENKSIPTDSSVSIRANCGEGISGLKNSAESNSNFPKHLAPVIDEEGKYLDVEMGDNDKQPFECLSNAYLPCTGDPSSLWLLTLILYPTVEAQPYEIPLLPLVAGALEASQQRVRNDVNEGKPSENVADNPAEIYCNLVTEKPESSNNTGSTEEDATATITVEYEAKNQVLCLEIESFEGNTSG